jgi:hypothetical protein
VTGSPGKGGRFAAERNHWRVLRRYTGTIAVFAAFAAVRELRRGAMICEVRNRLRETFARNAIAERF